MDFDTEVNDLILRCKNALNIGSYNVVFNKLNQLLQDKEKIKEYREHVLQINKKRWDFEKQYRYKPQFETPTSTFNFFLSMLRKTLCEAINFF